MEEPPTDVPLAVELEANIGEPVEVSNEHSPVKANIGEPLEGSKLNGVCEKLVISDDAVNNDQITEEKAVNQAPEKEHDNQVTVDGDGRVVFEENEKVRLQLCMVLYF